MQDRYNGRLQSLIDDNYVLEEVGLKRVARIQPHANKQETSCEYKVKNPASKTVR